MPSNARGNRLENGMTHAHAAAADWLALAERAPDEETRLAALLEPLSHLAWDTLGAGEFAYADGIARWDEAAFLAAMEAEDETAALARIRGAIAEHVPYARLRPAFGASALSHYADFGHSAIYTLKTGQLIDRLGDDAKEPVLLALVRQQIHATREERLPEFRGYAQGAGGLGWKRRGARESIGLHRADDRWRAEARAGVIRQTCRASSTRRCWARRRGTCCISISPSIARPATPSPTTSAGSTSPMR